MIDKSARMLSSVRPFDGSFGKNCRLGVIQEQMSPAITVETHEGLHPSI